MENLILPLGYRKRCPAQSSPMISSILSSLWIGLPVLAWIGNLLIRKRMHPALLFVLTGVAGYVVLLASVWALEVQLEAEMNSYDLDGDGAFRGAELTPAAERAMAEWSSDTGRTFAPIVGIPLTAAWYSIIFVFVFCGEWIFRRCFARKPDSDHSAPDRNSQNPLPSDDINPYRPPNVG